MKKSLDDKVSDKEKKRKEKEKEKRERERERVCIRSSLYDSVRLKVIDNQSFIKRIIFFNSFQNNIL